MVLSSVAHLWALRRFLPVPEIDEPFFVRPAVQFAGTGDPNPGWFGHPGSTVIYPLAGLFQATKQNICLYSKIFTAMGN